MDINIIPIFSIFLLMKFCKREGKRNGKEEKETEEEIR